MVTSWNAPGIEAAQCSAVLAMARLVWTTWTDASIRKLLTAVTMQASARGSMNTECLMARQGVTVELEEMALNAVMAVLAEVACLAKPLSVVVLERPMQMQTQARMARVILLDRTCMVKLAVDLAEVAALQRLQAAVASRTAVASGDPDSLQ